jgi:hypothetical protein
MMLIRLILAYYTLIGMDWLRRTYVSGKSFATDYVDYVNISVLD